MSYICQTRNSNLQEQWALAMTIGLIPQLECFWSFSFQTCESLQVPETTKWQYILQKFKNIKMDTILSCWQKRNRKIYIYKQLYFSSIISDAILQGHSHFESGEIFYFSLRFIRLGIANQSRIGTSSKCITLLRNMLSYFSIYTTWIQFIYPSVVVSYFF